MPKSELACLLCRKRKVKCDRELPQCIACAQSEQRCVYPLRPMKPGPKIGTFQRHKRNRQAKGTTIQRRQAGCSSSSPSNSYDGDFNPMVDMPEKELYPRDSPAAAQVEAYGEESQQSKSYLNMHNLSFILHPSHESSSPTDNDHITSPTTNEGKQTDLFHRACCELGLSQSIMSQIIQAYFDNMVAINLFHEPSFSKKLLEIPSVCQINALLAAMASYASRFLLLDPNSAAGDALRLASMSHPQSAHFNNLAFTHIDQALAECGDEMPPLCVIQALIIATHCQLTRGVHGRAWRSLGLCVRLAYETNLHILDSKAAVKEEDPVLWQADEEKRRAFWAIWEMDVFASTIRRTPTAIDWRQIEILLPVDNSDWFQGHPAPSCFMEADETQRWKALQDSNNQSPKAWFLVINSLMKAAQIISNPRGVSPIGNPAHYQPTYRTSMPESVKEARQKLEMLANSVRCFGLALPSRLQYRDQHLSFSPAGPRQLVESQRQQHCSIYNIFVMTQLTRLMIHRYDAFRHQPHQSKNNGRHFSEGSTELNEFGTQNSESVALRHYFDAADKILRIVNQSPEEHIQHINPFLSSTIWLASAVQLVRKYFVPTPAERSLVKSRFDVLYFTYKRCVCFWDTQTALQENLDSLGEQLETKQNRLHNHVHQPPKVAEPMPEKGKSTERSIDQSNCGSKKFSRPPHTFTNIQTSSKFQDKYSTESPANPAEISVFSQNDLQSVQTDSYRNRNCNSAENMAMLDYMSIPEVNRNQASGSYIMPTDCLLFDPIDIVGTQQDQGSDWRNLDFSGGIHDLLAGWSTY